MTITSWFVPVIILIILLYAMAKKVPVYDVFIEGASDGVKLTMTLLPHFLAMLAGVYLMKESGLLQSFAALFSWITKPFGISSDVLPLLPLRSLTGSGALAYATELMRTHGVDSIAGRIAAVVQGSSETTLYVISIYLGAIGIKKSGYAFGVGLFADFIGFLAACAVCLMWQF